MKKFETTFTTEIINSDNSTYPNRTYDLNRNICILHDKNTCKWVINNENLTFNITEHGSKQIVYLLLSGNSIMILTKISHNFILFLVDLQNPNNFWQINLQENCIVNSWRDMILNDNLSKAILAFKTTLFIIDIPQQTSEKPTTIRLQLAPQENFNRNHSRLLFINDNSFLALLFTNDGPIIHVWGIDGKPLYTLTMGFFLSAINNTIPNCIEIHRDPYSNHVIFKFNHYGSLDTINDSIYRALSLHEFNCAQQDCFITAKEDYPLNTVEVISQVSGKPCIIRAHPLGSILVLSIPELQILHEIERIPEDQLKADIVKDVTEKKIIKQTEINKTQLEENPDIFIASTNSEGNALVAVINIFACNLYIETEPENKQMNNMLRFIVVLTVLNLNTSEHEHIREIILNEPCNNNNLRLSVHHLFFSSNNDINYQLKFSEYDNNKNDTKIVANRTYRTTCLWSLSEVDSTKGNNNLSKQHTFNLA